VEERPAEETFGQSASPLFKVCYPHPFSRLCRKGALLALYPHYGPCQTAVFPQSPSITARMDRRGCAAYCRSTSATQV